MAGFVVPLVFTRPWHDPPKRRTFVCPQGSPSAGGLLFLLCRILWLIMIIAVCS
jgi:hypothetical protein